MGTLCSKPRPEIVSDPVSSGRSASIRHSSFDDQFAVEKAEHRFLTGAFGTVEQDKWNLKFLSNALNSPLKHAEELLGALEPETQAKLPPVLNSDGSIYHGEWKNKLFDGNGHLFMEDGTQYIGSFSKGKFSGAGEMLFANGDTFKGLFFQGERHGKGVLKFKNGDMYEGMWTHGSRHGYGTERFADGTVFMGNFRYNKRSGHGELRKPDGTNYEGHFSNNLVAGIGQMNWPNGDSYSGGFKNGLKNGLGTTIMRYGEYVSHKGTYKDGKMCGHFKSVRRDGSVEEALYEDDIFIRYLDSEESKVLNYPSRYPSVKAPPPPLARTSTKMSAPPPLMPRPSFDSRPPPKSDPRGTTDPRMYEPVQMVPYEPPPVHYEPVPVHHYEPPPYRSYESVARSSFDTQYPPVGQTVDPPQAVEPAEQEAGAASSTTPSSSSMMPSAQPAYSAPYKEPEYAPPTPAPREYPRGSFRYRGRTVPPPYIRHYPRDAEYARESYPADPDSGRPHEEDLNEDVPPEEFHSYRRPRGGYRGRYPTRPYRGRRGYPRYL